MAVLVVIEAFCLAQTAAQLDRFVARNQPLAILPTVTAHLKKRNFMDNPVVVNNWKRLRF